MKRLLAAAAAFALSLSPALSLPGEKWAQADPQMRNWILTLHSQGSKAWCCSLADGEFTQQDIRKGADGEDHFFVSIGDRWVEVPDAALVTDPNLLGRPIVWYYLTTDGPIVRCMLPGALF